MSHAGEDRERRTGAMYLRVEPSLHERLKQAAEKQNTSYSQVVRELCREGLDRREELRV